ncbi:MAG TPA: TonB-dependent receptor [Cyclobacteriaceae bacterium]|nr:TonB-dependent receptor [Cyclobacteriaceae bacterium]
MKRPLLLLFLLASLTVSAQDSRLSGQVISNTDNSGLPGVNVVVKGTSRGTITDLDGKFSIELPTPSVLIFSFIGYKSQEILFNSQTNIQIVLEEEPKELSEVVVVGYQSVEKRNVTGAVTSVKASSFKDMSINSLDMALQGQAPGVQVTQSSGTPGGGVQVRIRGVTSISASNSPLYVIDGIPVETGLLSQRDFGGQNDNALALLNTGDYESFTILADAAAKAQYGSRASNGVIVITTKKGKNGVSKITFDVQRGIVDPTHKLDLLNSTELLTIQREAVTNAGQNADALGLIPGVTDAVNTDWQDAVLRRGIMEQYQATASGGDNRTTFYISGHYRNEEGIQLNNSFQRYGTTLNFEHGLTQRLKLSTKVVLTRSLNKRVKGDNFLDGVFSGAIKGLPYNVPFDENGALVGPGSHLYAGFPNFNPVAQAVLPRFETVSVKMQGFVKGDYKINDNMSLVGQVSLDYNDITEDNYESSQTAIGGFLPSVGQQGYGIFNATTVSTVVSNARLTYNKSFDKHSLNALLGTELLQNFATGGSATGRLFTSDDFTYINSAGLVDNGGSFREPAHTIASFFGTADYDYDDRYLASFSMRADGSSNFGANNRFGYFPALSAGWRISSEEFFDSKLVNDLKVRASYGYTGNERIGAFTFLGLWGPTTYSGSSGVRPNGLDNPDIKWETTREVNLGVDVSAWESRVQATVQVYDKTTTGLLLARPYALTTGFASITSNIGSMNNQGFEFVVNTVNLDGDLKWRTNVNVSRNINKVLSLVDSVPLYRGYSAEGVDGTNIIKEGEPIGAFFGLNYLGVNPATGDAIYEDRSKDGLITNADAMVIGNSWPKLIGGMTNTVSYKGFDLSVLFNFSWGNKILNYTKAGLVNMGTDIHSNQSVDALRRWQKPGDVTDIPRYEFGNTSNTLHSNRLLEDGSYLRLKNLSFGYNLPSQWTSRYKLTGVRVYVSATNLWTLTKYSGSDPEVSTLDGSSSAAGIDFYTLPQVKTMAAGITISL